MKRSLRSRGLSVVLAAAVALTSFALPGAVKQSKAYDENSTSHPTNAEAVAAPQLTQSRVIKSGNNIVAYEYKTNSYPADSYTIYGTDDNGFKTTSKWERGGDSTLCYEYSNNPDFKNDSSKDQETAFGSYWYDHYYSTSTDDPVFRVNTDSAKPGETIYVRTYAVKDVYTDLTTKGYFFLEKGESIQLDGKTRTVDKDTDDSNYYYLDEQGRKVSISVENSQRYNNATSNAVPASNEYHTWIKRTFQSPVSNVLQFTVPVQNAVISETVVKPTSVTLKLSSGINANGFIIYRKTGKGKYKQIAKTNKYSFKDSGLTKGKTYTYRVKSYFFNDKTRQTLNSDSYAYTKAITAGSSLNLRAGASGKKVKLTWQKVKGVKKYVVYRSQSSSASDSVKNGYSNSYESWKQVKTLKKSKKSWTDKNVNSTDDYRYEVRAYLSKSLYVKANAAINFSFSAPEVQNQQIDENTVLAFWDKVPGATGYQVTKDSENYDANTKRVVTSEVVVSDLGANQTSVKLTNDAGHDSTTYHIYSKNGNAVSYSSDSVTVQSYIGSTKAKATAAANGIQVSWDPVPGATYYTVSRYTYADTYYYNENMKTYSYDSDSGKLVNKIYGVQQYPQAYIDEQKKTNPDFSETAHITYDTRNQYVYAFTEDGKSIDWSKTETIHSSDKEPVAKGERDSVREAYEITGTSVLDQYVKDGTSDSDYEGPKPGVTYYYVVTAHNDSSYDYRGKDADAPNSHVLDISSYGVKGIASASWGSASVTAKKTSVKKLTAKKTSVKVKVKGVAGAEYIIYRSTKKKSGYQVAGYTNKTTFTDTDLSKGTKYYYKVVTSVKNDAGQYITSAASKVKNVKTKGKKAKTSSKKSTKKKSGKKKK